MSLPVVQLLSYDCISSSKSLESGIILLEFIDIRIWKVVRSSKWIIWIKYHVMNWMFVRCCISQPWRLLLYDCATFQHPFFCFGNSFIGATDTSLLIFTQFVVGVYAWRFVALFTLVAASAFYTVIIFDRRKAIIRHFGRPWKHGQTCEEYRMTKPAKS